LEEKLKVTFQNKQGLKRWRLSQGTGSK